MEYNELETLWKRYDEKLDSLEKINKKLLKESLLKRPERKLSRFKYSNFYGAVFLPIIIIIAMHPHFKIDSLNWIFVAGCILSISIILYLSVVQYKSYSLIRNINLSTNSVIDSLDRITHVKRLSIHLKKYVYIYYPLLYTGVLMMGAHNFIFSTRTILFLTILFIITYLANIKGIGSYNERIRNLEEDILQLKEYNKE